MTDFSKRIANLSPEQREMLRRQLEQHRTGTQPQPILPQPRPNNQASLSYAQLRLWLLDQLHPDTAAYNLHGTVRLEGQLNIAAFEQSLNAIIRRHETLRTSFIEIDNQPVQYITPHVSLPLPVVVLRGLSPEQQKAETLRLMNIEALRPFNLAQSPLLRTVLLQTGEADYLLLLTIHHIVSDSWSIGVFIRELTEFYAAHFENRTPQVPALPIQYADFSDWQRNWLENEGAIETQLDYWKKHLDGATSRLDMPTDFARPLIQDFRGAHSNRSLSLSLSNKIKELCKQENVTPFMTMLATFQLLLARYSGQESIVVGSPIANRNRHEIEGLIGFFVNTLVLNTSLSGDPSFTELLARVREVCLGAYAHQDLPFEKLVEALQPERDLGFNPLFDVMLDFPNTPQTTLVLPGLTLSFEQPTETDSKFILTLYVFEHEGQYQLQLLYQRAVFAPERMAAFLEQFDYLLQQIVAAPRTHLNRFSLVTPSSASRLPDPTAILPEPSYPFVTTSFAGWAARQPAHPAVVQAGQTVTYSELEQNARTLAGLLLGQGLKLGEVVAIIGPRSAGVITGMLATLWSGGVLLTIDHSLPENRQRLMLEQGQVKQVVMILPKGIDSSEIVLDTASRPVIQLAAETGQVTVPQAIPALTDTLPSLLPESPAYLFFTSGTTGVPKGVLGNHKGLSHFITWQRDTFEIGPHDHCAQLTNLSFDVVLRDILTPLVSGATLYLPDDVDDLGSDQILPWFEREQISLLHTVPTLALSWLENVPEGISLRALRHIFFAGEPLTDVLIQRWRGAFPKAGQIINLYGPTETTLAKFFFVVPEPPLPGIQPVGWPLPHTQPLVLNENGQLCGFGESGQIVIRTPYCTLGYANSPEETKKRFIKNPFRDDEDDRLYYTGDRGRYRLDGSLEIMGRLDHQVKIRGVRVEPDEVAAILAQHPAVSVTVVIAWKDVHGQNNLAAYIVPTQPDDFNLDAVKWHLGIQLPAAMIPSTFILLDSLPRTPNGKVDRRALPRPDGGGNAVERAIVPPGNVVEEVLLGLWIELLETEPISIHDNFFELRGHSLLATQLIAQLRDIFHVKIRLRDFYNKPTIAGLSALLLEDPADHERVNKTAEALLQVAGLSDDEVDVLLMETQGE